MTRALLDTNVLSELIRPRPDASVIAWISAQSTDGLFISAVTQAEMLVGARILPLGQRRHALEVGGARQGSCRLSHAALG